MRRLTGSRGFSLVELMVTLVIVAVLLAVGNSALRTFVENGRIRAAGESWKNGLALARAEALRLNTLVEFALLNTGWEVRQVADGVVLHQGLGREGIQGLDLEIEPEGSDRVTFDAFGRVVEPNPSDESEPIDEIAIGAIAPPSDLGYRPLRLQLLAGGTPRLCDPAAPDDDPRTCL